LSLFHKTLSESEAIAYVKTTESDNHLQIIRYVIDKGYSVTVFTFPSGGQVQVYFPVADVERFTPYVRTILAGLQQHGQSEEIFEASKERKSGPGYA